MLGHVVQDPAEAIQIAKDARTVAVLGIKPESHASQPAYFVPEYLQHSGITIIPVPTYYPNVQTILNEPVVRDLKAINLPVDILDVFRKPSDLPGHVEDILAMDPKPKVVWLQSGCSNHEVENLLADKGFIVVSDRCLKVDRAAATSISKF